MKRIATVIIAFGGLLGNTYALADNHTVSVGYAQSKVQGLKDIRGVNAQYRYEWDSPISVIGSFSYMKGDHAKSYHDEAGDFYKQHADVKYYSFLAGPAYRINDYVSLYGLMGISHTKADGGYEWRNSVGADKPSGHERGSVSGKSTNFAYATGLIINPMENLSVNVGYEGSRASIHGKHSINGFNVGVGYRF
ncbi:Ail/Lom family protein [Xenorhabdus sp. 12]|uniref:Ail/Lom family protein n=1 Tax=Xenorhabdus santafensis TaxID=2582833 RepID=A0ABU4S721_9GAMM|nr:Ail/Lom family outer membrane beta-barrel protein [Xenorhabdus sp. 12]MDX7986658.1 Ail/Lom family protein [Xenorhabdus sp. 12]